MKISIIFAGLPYCLIAGFDPREEFQSFLAIETTKYRRTTRQPPLALARDALIVSKATFSSFLNLIPKRMPSFKDEISPDLFKANIPPEKE